MAQAVKCVDGQSLWCQIQAAKKQQYTFQGNSSVIGHLNARDLKIHCVNDTRYWKWNTMPIDGNCIEVAELIIINWLRVDGKYEVNKLTGGMDYQVKFVLKLLNNFDIVQPVSFSLTTPEGCKQEHTENMINMPSNQVICITAGEFQTPQNGYGCGEINFTMMNPCCAYWMRGLVVIGAVVVPKFKIKPVYW